MKIVKKLLPLIIIVLGICIAYTFMATKPTPQRAVPPPIVPQVEVITVTHGSVPIIIDTIGTLVPSQEVDIKSKVSGTVASLAENFQPGAFVQEGDILLQLETIDYELALQKAEASLAQAQADYDIELGQQNVARNEYNQLSQIAPNVASSASINASLALREPQLAKAEANVAIAQANLDTARIDLENTIIRAPFDALITSRSVSTGQHIGTSEVLANLIDIDEYWVDVTIAVETLYNNDIISHDASQLPVTVVTKANEEWQGELLQTVNVLTSGSRMGKLLVSIDDPLALEHNAGKVPLLMGDQVTILLEAGVFENVAALPRSAVKNNTTVWLVVDSLLQSVEVEVLWKNADISYVDAANIPNGSLVMISDMTNPTNTMEVLPVEISE